MKNHLLQEKNTTSIRLFYQASTRVPRKLQFSEESFQIMFRTFELDYMKEKIQLEYVLTNISVNILWNSISTPVGLSEWFADKVSIEENVYTFQWGKSLQKAELIQNRSGNYMRFRWLDDDEDKTYFEFHIYLVELTGDIILTITDFVSPDEKEEIVVLWNKEVGRLKKAYGI